MIQPISNKSVQDSIPWRALLLSLGAGALLTIGCLAEFHVLHSIGSLSDHAIHIGAFVGAGAFASSVLYLLHQRPKKEEKVIITPPLKEIQEEMPPQPKQQVIDFWVEEKGADLRPGPEYRMVVHGIFPEGEPPIGKLEANQVLEAIQSLDWTLAIIYRGSVYLNHPERVTINKLRVGTHKILIKEDGELFLSKESTPIPLICPSWDR